MYKFVKSINSNYELHQTECRLCSLTRATFNILIIKANEMHYFSNLPDKVLYMFRTGSLSIISSISKLYTCNRYLSC